jgi:hypothetical protein
MFDMYDTVQTTVQLNDNIPANTRGVIVMILDKDKEVYLVELFNMEHETIGIEDIPGICLKQIPR